ncbi:MAG: DEAD/DEAH box helicase [Spirochaetes bacterium]|nr:DEAD/DEAH box helicase [Spirochaetota bacterium]
MNIRQLIEYLRNYEAFMQNVKLWLVKEPVDAVYSEYPENINPLLKEKYIEKGVKKLYSHQRTAFDLISENRDVVIVTPTASGKTICYNLPVLNYILENPEARALYLFPTKALSQDQMNDLNVLIGHLEKDIRTYTFDGDTPSSARKAIREAGHIVVTNPDMLHSGILPHHTKWVRLFENLKFIVIDEVHTYRGVFGSHFANLMRRLKRLCSFYGSSPVFIMCSATIHNPKSHAESLIEKHVELIDKNGAPSGEKHIVIYNPPVVNEQLGIRSSSVKEVAKLGSLILKNKIPAIVFARSRMRVEIITTYLNEQCPGLNIKGYRGGYLPNERRAIEKGLRDRSIDGVVSTNALELGIDIGMLDAVITTGYPGSFSSMMQQFGRAGRRNDKSLAIMVATSSPLDQYIASNPHFLEASNPETASVNADNLLILMDHIKCAAFELPFGDDEKFAEHLSTTAEMLTYLEEMNVLKKTSGKYHWMSDIYPANSVSLRSAAQENFVIIDKTHTSRVIGEVDYYAAPELIHDDAVYIHQGQQYYIDKLDWDRRMAYAHEIDSEYYTDSQTKTDIHVIESFETINRNFFEISRGEINVRTKVMMFKKIRFHTHENLGWADIHLPEIEMHTTSAWLDFDAGFIENLAGKEFAGTVLYSLSYLIKNLSPVFTFSDIADIHSLHQSRSSYSKKPAVFIYDSMPGGVGLSEKIFNSIKDICIAALNSVKTCECTCGCPGCIGPVSDTGSDVKHLTIALMEQMLSALQSGGNTVH